MASRSTSGWLGITDKYWATALMPPREAELHRPLRPYHRPAGAPLPGRFPRRRRETVAGRRQRREHEPALRRRQAGRASSTATRSNLDIERFELLIDWGWFYFITKPMFFADRLALPRLRQFRRRHPAGDGHRQGDLLPARQQLLQVDERDEEGAAADGRAPRALQGRQGQAAAGADGALQEGEDQPARRLLADRGPDPGLLRALQGAVRHHRDAPRAVLRLDPGPLGARPDQPLQPLRPDPVVAAAPS